MKAIVFGGSGFLGSHVADALTDKGYDVVIFDLISSPYLKGNQTMIVGDILDPDQVQKAVIGCDYVYNLAGIADLDDATTKPIQTVQLNIIGNLNIMQAAVAQKVRRFIYASSIYVYSQKGGFYRCSKQASELYIEEYQHRFGVDYTILRYGTLYGPRADQRNAIFNYLKQALETKTLRCPNPMEMREYINVKDAAALSVEILNDDYKNRHIILTGHYHMKVQEMMMIIREIFNDQIEIIYTEKGENNDHYSFTPYSFSPRIGHKLVGNCYVDIGQGLLECLQDLI